MILGDNIIGIASHRFDDNELNTYILKVNLFPFSFCFERNYDVSHTEIKLILFNTYTIGVYLAK
tara:strand:- start:17132 stop:17323 length:192 start_codon:yes stop_codon:yes gene_type:complete